MFRIRKKMSISTRAEKKLEFITHVLEELNEQGENGTPIIVEGKKDLSALRELGIHGRILCVKNSGKVLVDKLDEVTGEEVALFVDFDDTGVSLAEDITQYLEGKGVKVNSLLWRKIRRLLRRDVQDIEGVPSYLEKLKKRVNTL